MGLRLPTETLAPLVVAALLITVAVATLLWAAGVPTSASRDRVSPQEDPFPLVLPSSDLHVLPVPASTNASTWLTLLSIQGLANREHPQLYLDSDNETGNPSSMLSFLTARYGVSYDMVTRDWVYSHYLPALNGLVIVDPSRPESVNIATMVASLQDAAIAGPDTAPSLERLYGLSVVLDYAASNWTSTDSTGVYDRALATLYPKMDSNLLAILPPNEMPLRDYLIATRTFVFYEPQGIFALPGQLAATQRVLAAAPRGIPILGWFDNPTLTEENAFIQLASQYGKPVFGSQEVPNLSVLTAYGRNEVRSQPAPPPTPPLENKTYVVVAVPDGDNLDFIHHRLPALWEEPERGTFPIAWSLSPLLADLAPPYLDYYYGSATPDDRFVLGPSGAGYVYPDSLGPGDLGPYLESTARYANATGMDVAWLLNAFVASEIPYGSSTLSAYVDALRPRGIVLDYDDQAKTQETWMQSGASAAAPVIRSTQAWTTMDNFLAKVGDAMATWDSGPHFLWVTVYTFRFDLHDAATLIHELADRTAGKLAVVTPEQLFDLMDLDFIARAHEGLASLRANPVAAAFFRPQIDAAQGWLDTPSGSAAVTAYYAYEASVDLRDAGLYEGALALGLVVVAGALVSLGPRWPGRASGLRTTLRKGRPILLIAAAFALLVLATRAALAANFWSYQWVVAGVVLAGAGRPLRRFLDRAYPRASTVLIGALDAVFIALSMATNVAFPLAAIGTVAVVDATMARERVGPEATVIAVSLGVAVGFVAGVDLLSFAVFAAGLLLPLINGIRAPVGGEMTPSNGALARGFVLVLPSVALLVASTFSLGLRLGVQGDDLPLLGGALLALGSLAGILVARGRVPTRTREVQVLAFAVAAVSLASVGFATGTALVVLLMAAGVGSAAVAATATMRRFASSGRDTSAIVAAAVPWIPLFLMFYRMPPVIYSLALVHFPEAVEAVFYAPQYALAAAAAVLAFVTSGLHLRARSKLRTSR